MISLRQGAAPWGDMSVGNSSKTYRAVGCVATAMTAAVNALRGTNFTPADLRPGGRAGLTSAHYTGASMFTDSVAQTLGLKIEGRISPTPANRSPQPLARMKGAIDGALAHGGLALVRVDYDLTSEDSNHTITCFAHDASGYRCADPANGDIISLSEDLMFQRTSTKLYAAVGVAPIFRR